MDAFPFRDLPGKQGKDLSVSIRVVSVSEAGNARLAKPNFFNKLGRISPGTACLLACWLAGLPALLQPCFLHACLLAWLVCLLACLPACLQRQAASYWVGTKITGGRLLACWLVGLLACPLALLLGLHACMLACLACQPGLPGVPGPPLPGLACLACWLACLLAGPGLPACSIVPG